MDESQKAGNGGVTEFFSTWNSPDSGNYGIGGYLTYALINGHYKNNLGIVNDNIESGQAFFVQTDINDGQMVFNETSKSSGFNNTVFRNSTNIVSLFTRLYSFDKTGKAIINDGTIMQFDNQFSNKVDRMDATKMLGGGINLSIKKDNKLLVVERMGIPESKDTVFMNFTGLAATNYRFVFLASAWAGKGVTAFLEDHYLNTITPINLEDSTIVNFSVDKVKQSFAANRFDIIFKPEVILPVSITSVAASVKEKDIEVKWTVINEKNVHQYEVERSTDGVQFVKVASIAATNSGTANYTWLDKNVLSGYYYYRIKSIDNKGREQYSETVKVLIGTDKPVITIYPNPIRNGIINLHFLNLPAGAYGIRLMNQLGQIIVSKQVVRMGGSSTESIQWDYNLSHGIYQLQITLPDGGVKMIKVLY
jgi:hypothetical protein